MAISPRMLAVIQKVDAAREEVLRGIRKRLKLEVAAKERAKRLQATNPKRTPPAQIIPSPIRRGK